MPRKRKSVLPAGSPYSEEPNTRPSRKPSVLLAWDTGGLSLLLRLAGHKHLAGAGPSLLGDNPEHPGKLDASTSGVLARYQHPEGKSYLLLIDYPTPAQARDAYDSFLAAYMPEATNTGAAQTENGKWTSARVQVGKPERVAVVFDAPALARAEALLETVRK